jgi:predicted acetyltransferase
MHIRTIQNHAERAQVSRWAAEAFGPHEVESGMRFWTEMLPREPGYGPERQRVVEADGQLVSHLRIVDREMQVGLATLRMGGISGLVTPPEQRGRGYACALMEDTVDYLAAQGFDLTCLDGAPGFYQRFGYATVMPHRQVRVCVAEALALSSPLTVRPLLLSDGPALAPLYERCWRGRVGALVRDEAIWRWQLETWPRGCVALDAGGRVRGYAVYGNRDDWVAEAAAADSDAVTALLHHLARRAQEAHKEAVCINLPADVPLVRLARTLCSVEIVERTRPGAGWQARLLNVASAFARLEPELSARLARSTQPGWRGRLRLETEIGGVTLRVDRTGVRVDKRPTTEVICHLPQDRLTQLLFGYITVAEAAVMPGSSIPYAASPIMAALFPPVAACIAGLDWF